MSIAEKLQTIAENEKKVYDAGYAKGKSEGGDTDAAYQQGIADGRQAEYDHFWDVYQDNGNRTEYKNAFCGNSWNTKTFKPKYDIILSKTTSSSAFNDFGDSDGIDLVNILEECGVIIDFSNVYTAPSLFNGANITTLPPIYAPILINWSYTFYGCKFLKAIDYTSSPKTVVNSISNAFTNCSSLTDVNFTDTTIANNVSFQWSPLTKASIESVIASLSDTVSGNTASFKSTAVNTAFETSQGAADGSASEEWLALVAAKPNWTITLA